MVEKLIFSKEFGGTGVLLDWAVIPGDIVDRGEPVCTIETAAGSLEIVANVSGKIQDLAFEPGEEVQPGETLALIGEPGYSLKDEKNAEGRSQLPEEVLAEEVASDGHTAPSSGPREDGSYDLLVIGGGPAGYRAAERAALQGKRVALVEEHLIGGTCLNFGCIPAKTFINAAKVYRDANMASYIGVESESVHYDHATALAWKDYSVKRLRRGVEGQLERAGVTVFHGTGRLEGAGKVDVSGRKYRADNILIATGSTPAKSSIPTDQATVPVIGSTAAFDLDRIPGRAVVIGAGYIGLEIAGLLSTLGSEVTVLESASEGLAFAGPEVGRQMRLAMTDVSFELNAEVLRVVDGSVYYRVHDDGDEQSIETDLVVAVIGRAPRLGGVAESGVVTDETGIVVDEQMRTNLSGVYAAGDVTGKLMLAHAAYRMADVAVNAMFGDGTDRLKMESMPWIVYTIPELAGCGLSEAQARENGLDVGSNLYPLASNNRYIAEHTDPRGWCRIVYEQKSGRIVGSFMLGDGVSELIGQAAMAIETRMTVQQLARVVAPHPTLSEAFRDAADAANQLKKTMAADHAFHPHL